MSAQVSLKQTKVWDGSNYGVRTQIEGAVPARLLNAFVLRPLDGVERELLVRVATLEDLADDMAIPTNPLTAFKPEAAQWGSVAYQVGDVLKLPATGESVPVAGLDEFNARLLLSEQLWYRGDSLAWELWRAGATSAYLSGTQGEAQRLSTSISLYKCDRLTALFSNTLDAFNHIASVQACVRALVNAVDMDPLEYTTPDNPIVTTIQG